MGKLYAITLIRSVLDHVIVLAVIHEVPWYKEMKVYTGPITEQIWLSSFLDNLYCLGLWQKLAPWANTNLLLSQLKCSIVHKTYGRVKFG